MAGTRYVYMSSSAPGLAVTQLLPFLVPGGVRLPPTPIAMCHRNVKSLSVRFPRRLKQCRDGCGSVAHDEEKVRARAYELCGARGRTHGRLHAEDESAGINERKAFPAGSL
jgi:hypothetical protein